MRRSRRAIALPVVLVATAWACGTRPLPGAPLGIGTLGSGGGTEIVDGGSTSGSGSGERSGSSGGSGRGASSGSSGASRGGAGATGAESGSSTSGNVSSGSTTEAADAGDAGDAGAGGVVLTIPAGPIHIVSLHWTISGPNTYQGSVEFGDAQSFEWVVGGIVAAHGYTLSVTATDALGDPCKGTSSPFNVVPGVSTYTMITITCDVAAEDQADVTTGSVAIEAGVVAASD